MKAGVKLLVLVGFLIGLSLYASHEKFSAVEKNNLPRAAKAEKALGVVKLLKK